MSALTQIQSELKAPKNRTNQFGGYNYRSCEDILEAVKPLLLKYGASMAITDSMVAVGERIYVKATVNFQCKDETVAVTAFAREADVKKGMDVSQITGTASSYARKYALNGLFLIDDTNDADTEEYKKQIDNAATIQATKVKTLEKLLGMKNVSPDVIYKEYHVDSLAALTEAQYTIIVKRLEITNGK